MTGDAKPVVVIGDRAVTWVLGVSGLATFAFFSWLAVTVLQVQSAVGHLSDQVASIRETRADAFTLVRDRLDHLSDRVKQLENAFESLRRSDERRK